MCYTNKQLENRARKLEDLKAQKKAIEEAIALIEEDLKQDLGENNKVETEHFKISFTSFISHRFDSSTFKKDHSKLYEQYQIEYPRTTFTCTAK